MPLAKTNVIPLKGYRRGESPPGEKTSDAVIQEMFKESGMSAGAFLIWCASEVAASLASEGIERGCPSRKGKNYHLVKQVKTKAGRSKQVSDRIPNGSVAAFERMHQRYKVWKKVNTAISALERVFK